MSTPEKPRPPQDTIKDQEIRRPEGLDCDAIRTILKRFSDLIPDNAFQRVVCSYNSSFSNCADCGRVFADRKSIGIIVHWKGNEKRGRKMRGQDHVNDSWPSDNKAVCSVCALGYVEAVVVMFKELRKSSQIAFLRSLSGVIERQSNRGWGNPIGQKFFTKLTERLLDGVSLRGHRQITLLTKMLTSCNLICND
jgi:hypothetical protein